MKRKIITAITAVALALILLPSCKFDAEQSVKAISKPYIALYECVEARYGDTDILEDYEYINIIFENTEDMTLEYKPKNGEKKIYGCKYSLDPETREFEAELGIWGYKFREKVKIENGSFHISKIIGDKDLFIKFVVK